MYYMKGKTRHWFWGELAVLLFSSVAQIITISLIGSLAQTMPESAVIAIATVMNVVTAGLMFVILPAYGLGNTVKTYKVLFITLLNLVQNALNVVLTAFFFGVMSFSGRKPPKAAPGTQAPTL